MRQQLLGLAFLVAAGPAAPAADDGASAPATRWWSHVATLADDALEGRETGSPGHRRAAEYVAGQFERLGLRPAGIDGYLQPVRFRSKKIDEAHSSLALVRGEASTPIVLGDDAVISLRIDPAAVIDAPLVFVGHGLRSPEAGVDDFAGLDVRGKVVVILGGAPSTIPGALAAHLQSAGERGALLRELGVAGLMTIPNPRSMDIPWERSSLARFAPAMSLADPMMDDYRGLRIAVTVNPARADKVLAGTGQTIAAILKAADADQALPHFEIPANLVGKVAVDRVDVISENVAAILPGTDDRLKDEYVAFTAHLDHLGVGRPINGDPIYNGAMDNASGVASLLDVAARLREANVALKRSILFVAVTGEEKGLLGSRFFADSPTVPARNIVANINTDMFLPLFPMKRLTVMGLAESDLGDDAATVARTLGVEPEPDPEPKRNVFIRSDQYSFIRQGVPALALKVGYVPGSPDEATSKRWLTERYHAPSDDLKQPVDMQSAADFDRLVAALVERVANRADRPAWKPESFFRRFAR